MTARTKNTLPMEYVELERDIYAESVMRDMSDEKRAEVIAYLGLLDKRPISDLIDQYIIDHIKQLEEEGTYL